MERTSDRYSSAPAGVLERPLRHRTIAAVTRVAADLVAPRRGVQPIEAGVVRRALGVWAIGRAVNLLLLFLFFTMSRAGGWGFGPGGVRVQSFLDFLSGWDADRYGTIAMGGYPTFIPLDEFGDVVPNNWAFLPVFPFLERALVTVTGMPWQLAGVILSIAASAAATVVLFLLLRAVTAPRQAWWAIVFFTFGPMSFVFVLAYAESLFLLLLFAALLLAVRRRYAWIAPLGVIAAFTRPGALALALALGILFVVRFARRARDPFPPRQLAGLLGAGIATAGAGLAWPVIADAVTGFDHAYVRTETAWWIPFVGRGDFAALTPWFRFGIMYAGVFGVLLVLAAMVACAWWVSSAPVRRLGIEVVAFAASYALYLFAVFLPQQSILRLMMPMAPLLADERLTSTRRRRVWMVTGCLVLQTAAVLVLWTLGYP